MGSVFPLWWWKTYTQRTPLSLPMDYCTNLNLYWIQIHATSPPAPPQHKLAIWPVAHSVVEKIEFPYVWSHSDVCLFACNWVCVCVLGRWSSSNVGGVSFIHRNTWAVGVAASRRTYTQVQGTRGSIQLLCNVWPCNFLSVSRSDIWFLTCECCRFIARGIYVAQSQFKYL